MTLGDQQGPTKIVLDVHSTAVIRLMKALQDQGLVAGYPPKYLPLWFGFVAGPVLCRFLLTQFFYGPNLLIEFPSIFIGGIVAEMSYQLGRILLTNYPLALMTQIVNDLTERQYKQMLGALNSNDKAAEDYVRAYKLEIEHSIWMLDQKLKLATE